MSNELVTSLVDSAFYRADNERNDEHLVLVENSSDALEISTWCGLDDGDAIVSGIVLNRVQVDHLIFHLDSWLNAERS